jgi:hypothetical protein
MLGIPMYVVLLLWGYSIWSGNTVGLERNIDTASGGWQGRGYYVTGRWTNVVLIYGGTDYWNPNSRNPTFSPLGWHPRVTQHRESNYNFGQSYFGFKYYSESRWFKREPTRASRRFVVAPIWFLTLLCCVPNLWLIGVIRRRRSIKRQGFDLVPLEQSSNTDAQDSL